MVPVVVPNPQAPPTLIEGTPEFEQDIRDLFALAAQPGFFDSQPPITAAVPAEAGPLPGTQETVTRRHLKRPRPPGRHYYY